MERAILVIIVLIACLSPLLTFAHLWQIKEWRVDRLVEHFRSEGWLQQLFGRIRPGLFVFFFIVGLAGMDAWQRSFLLTLALLNSGQFLIQRQPLPVWTMKAIALVAASLLLNFVVTIANYQLSIINYQFIALLPLLQPLVVLLAWLFFYPVDYFLKNHIIRQAIRLRTSFPNLMVIGITGSVGKTTTKELLRHVLKDKHMRATPEYLNAEIGIARWLIRALQQEHPPEILLVEMGAYKKGEISTLCTMAMPQRGVITSIGKQHLALFGSQEALRDAKAELIETLPPEGKAYLNADNTLCASVADRARCPVTLVGTGGAADVEAFDIEETAEGIRFRTGNTTFSLPLHGTHNVTNVLLAIAIARDLGMEDGTIATQLRTFQPPKNTFSVSVEHTVTVLNDTHNASVSSFRAAIAWARTQPIEERTLLTSGLMELGEAQDSIHAELGALAATVFTRVVFLHKRNARYFEKGYGKPVELYSATSAPVSQQSLLACIGRMPKSTITHLLTVH